MENRLSNNSNFHIQKMLYRYLSCKDSLKIRRNNLKISNYLWKSLIKVNIKIKGRESTPLESLEVTTISLHCKLVTACMFHLKCIRTSSSLKMEGNISSTCLSLAKSRLTIRCSKSAITMIQLSNVESRISTHRLSHMKEMQETSHHLYRQ